MSDAPIWREILEGLATRARKRGDADWSGIDIALSQMQRIESLPLSDPEHLNAFDELLQALAQVRGEMEKKLPAVAPRLAILESAIARGRSDALGCVVAEQHAWLHDRSSRDDDRGPFTASVGVPQLHAPPRGFIGQLHVRLDLDASVAAALADPEDDTALRLLEIAATPQTIAPHPLSGLARDCMDDIGAMGLLCDIAPDALFHARLAAFQQRLLDNLDALMALSRDIDIVTVIQRHAADAVVADPARAFACTFVLSCLRGPDAVRGAVDMMRHDHRDTFDSHALALALAPNPEIDAAMSRLGQDSDPALIALALRVARARHAVDFGICSVALGHPAPEVRATAARALAFADPRGSVVALLVDALADEDDTSVSRAIIETLLRHDHRDALRLLRDTHRAPLLLALAGNAADAPHLAGEVEAVGWLGSARALEALWQTVDAPTIGVLRAHARVAGPLGSLSSMAAAGDVKARALAACAALDRDVKYRFGQPWTIQQSLDELAGDDTTPEIREALAFEVALISGNAIRLRPRDWLTRQHEQIAAARAYFDDAPEQHRPGQWPAARLGAR